MGVPWGPNGMLRIGLFRLIPQGEERGGLWSIDLNLGRKGWFRIMLPCPFEVVERYDWVVVDTPPSSQIGKVF